MDRADEERALVGAALLDEAIARLLFSELRDHELLDPTARLACWALRRAYEPGPAIEAELEKAVREEELALFWAAVDGDERPVDDDHVPTDMTDVEIVIEALHCAGLMREAGGEDAILSLTADRPALRAALAAGRAALDGMAPIVEEPLVNFAAELLVD